MPQLTLSTSGALVAPQNKYRKSIVFTNVDTAIVVWIDNMQPGDITTSNAGVRLPPGASAAFNSFLDGSRQIQDRWSAIAESGTPVLAWKETEDIER